MHIYVLVSTMTLLGYIWYKSYKMRGRNSSTRLKAILTDLIKRSSSSTISEIGKAYKNSLNSLRAAEFKIFIASSKKLISEVSRGSQKLQDLLHQTGLRISGTVLSLACGRGVWEQIYAQSPAVISARCITFGSSASTPGHEEFTDRPFAGRSKCNVYNMDIRDYARMIDNSYHTWLLFDGGESRSNIEEEARKFYDLFHNGVMPKIHAGLKGFILKVLTPTDPRIIADLEVIRSITGMGNLYLRSSSRQSNMEMYFCSTTPLQNIERTIRHLLQTKWRKAETLTPLSHAIRGAQQGEREPIENKGMKILKPINMTKSFLKLGTKVPLAGRGFLHWKSLGVFPYGQRGSSNTCRLRLAWEILRPIANSLTRFMDWSATDTTPEGFEKVFIRKVDTAPVENSPYHERLGRVYDGLVRYFKHRGFRLNPLTDQEIMKRANMDHGH